MITLVLLPGMDGTGALFEDLVAELNNELSIRIVRFPVCEALDYAQLTEIARAYLPQAGKFVMLGESFSGPIAISLAANSPAGLIGLVLCCTFARNPRPRMIFLRSLTSAFPKLLVMNSVSGYFLLGRFATRKRIVELARAMAQVSPKTIRARLASVAVVDVLDKVKDIRVPILYLQASEDRVVPKDAARQIALRQPLMTVHKFVAPHFLLQVVPAEVARTIAAFVRRVDDQAGTIQDV